MPVKQIQSGLSLPEHVYVRVRELSEKNGLSQSAILRQLVLLALPILEKGHGMDVSRLIVLQEETVLALKVLINKLAPDEAQDLRARAIDMACEHHGG